MAQAPLFITRVNVAKGQDFAMIALGAPTGPLRNGVVENIEILRIVMSYPTLKQVAELLSHTIKEVEATAARAHAVIAREGPTFSSRFDERQAEGPQAERSQAERSQADEPAPARQRAATAH